jgi:hypothetical protein
MPVNNRENDDGVRLDAEEYSVRKPSDLHSTDFPARNRINRRVGTDARETGFDSTEEL